MQTVLVMLCCMYLHCLLNVLLIVFNATNHIMFSRLTSSRQIAGLWEQDGK